MSSIRRAPHTAPETAERIRDAAISEFSAHGFAKTTVRKVAAAAEVSAGLVIHHYGSKDGLRQACDDRVFESITETKRSKAAGPQSELFAMLTQGPMREHVEYLLKSLLDPSASGQRFFDHFIDVIEEIIDEGFAGYTFQESEDPKAQAAMIAILSLAPLMLEPRIRHSLGTENLPSTFARLTPQLFELYRHGLLATEPSNVPPAGPPNDSPSS